MNLTPIQPAPPPFELFFAAMADVGATTCRYVREDNGHVGGPIRYQRLRDVDTVAATDDGSGAHLHDRHPTPPANGTRCLVVVVGGDLDGAMAFPEILT